MNKLEDQNYRQTDQVDPGGTIAEVADSAVVDSDTVNETSAASIDTVTATNAEAEQPTPSGRNATDAVLDASNTAVTALADPIDVHKAKRLPRAGFPNKQVNPGENSRLPGTIPNLEYMLAGYRITARYNIYSKAAQINIPGLSGCPDNADNSAITHITSLAALNGLPTGPVSKYLDAIADNYQFNPVMDYISLKPWDGRDRIKELFKTLKTIPEFPKKLKKKLILCWLKSAVAAAASTDLFQTRGVLCLQGPQSIGKTRWVLALIEDMLLRSQLIKIDHHLDPGDKDSVITAISHWIVEIGELDSSFKKDISRLKGFISRPQDEVRRPYGAKDSVYRRRTVFIATVNHANFLVDDTGNTRWWTLPVTSINHNHGINTQQLWAQVYHLYLQDKCWWLSAEEELLLEEQNSKHRSVNSIRDVIYSALDASIPAASRTSMSASQLLRHLDIKNPSNAQSRDCGSALRELLGDPKVSQGLNRWMVPLAGDGEVFDL